MSLYIALTAAVSGLNVNQQQIANISKNVTNASTEGYTRKIISQSASIVGNTVVGVQANNASRVVSDTLIKEIRYQSGQLGYNNVQNDYFKLLQDMFGSPGGNTSLGNDLSQMSTSLQALAANPQSSVLQKNSVSDMLLATQKMNKMSRQIQDIRGQADREIDKAVDIINTQANLVADLNQRIASSRLNNSSSADLEDQRDEALRKISEYINISTFTRDDGQAAIFLQGTGGTLVDGQVFELSYTPASSLNAALAYPATIPPIYKEDSSGPVDVTTAFNSGRLGALIKIRDETAPELAAQLEVLATSMRDGINAVTNAGTAYPPPTSLTSTTTVSSADIFGGTAYSGVVRIGVVNRTDGSIVDNLDLNLSTLGVSPAAVTLATLQTALDGAFGAGNVTATINSDNKLVLSTASTFSAHGIAIGTVDATTAATVNGKGFSHYFGFNDVLTGTDNTSVAGDLAATITVRSSLLSNPALLPRGTLSSAAGIVAGANALSVGDNSSIQALVDKMNDDISYSAANRLPGISTNFAGYADLILSANANEAANIATTSSGIDDVLEELNFRAGAIGGVNVDEEMANLIIFQNAYGASARIITIVNELFDQLQQIMG